MKSDLIVRTDGSAEIGLGHLVRCISLGAVLKDLFRITFVCRSIPPETRSELDNHGFSLIKIDEEEQFFDCISPTTTVVLDGYSFDSAYQKKIKEAGSLLVCIDDLHEKKFFADLIINHAPGIREVDYTAKSSTQFALGPDYALLRPPFLEAATCHSIRKNSSPETILICFGGSDHKNLTVKVLNIVSDFNQFKKIVIITGSAYGFKNELLLKKKNDKRIIHYHALTGNEMAAVFLQSDVAVVPASGILFEALATGSRVISGMYTENQKEVYSGFRKLGAIVDAGRFSERKVRKAIHEISSHENRQQFIDGKSPQRLRKLFQNIKRD